MFTNKSPAVVESSAKSIHIGVVAEMFVVYCTVKCLGPVLLCLKSNFKFILEFPIVETANCIPAVLLPFPCVCQPVNPKPVLSIVVVSEEPEPELYEVVVNNAVNIPVPFEGLIEPVLVLASGGFELKFHCVITVCACNFNPNKTIRIKKNNFVNFFDIIFFFKFHHHLISDIHQPSFIYPIRMLYDFIN